MALDGIFQIQPWFIKHGRHEKTVWKQKNKQQDRSWQSFVFMPQKNIWRMCFKVYLIISLA